MNSLLIFSTCVCFIDYFIPIVIKYLMAAIYSNNNAEVAALGEIRKLEKEMSGISVVNEFARFMRLQRRHAKLKDELKDEATQKMFTRNKTRMYLTYGSKFINIIISLVLIYMYGKTPVIEMSQGLLWPLDAILNRSSESQRDAISLTSWMILTRLVANTLSNDYS